MRHVCCLVSLGSGRYVISAVIPIFVTELFYLDQQAAPDRKNLFFQNLKKNEKRGCQNEWDMVEYFLSERERF